MVRDGAGHACRLCGAAAFLLFTVFAGNIVMAKAQMLWAFSAPRLSPLWEFLILLVATLAGILFLLCEESKTGSRGELPIQGPASHPDNNSKERNHDEA